MLIQIFIRKWALLANNQDLDALQRSGITKSIR